MASVHTRLRPLFFLLHLHLLLVRRPANTAPRPTPAQLQPVRADNLRIMPALRVVLPFFEVFLDFALGADDNDGNGRVGDCKARDGAHTGCWCVSGLLLALARGDVPPFVQYRRRDGRGTYRQLRDPMSGSGIDCFWYRQSKLFRQSRSFHHVSFIRHYNAKRKHDDRVTHSPADTTQSSSTAYRSLGQLPSRR